MIGDDVELWIVILIVRVKRRSAVMNAFKVDPVYLRNPASETGIQILQGYCMHGTY